MGIVNLATAGAYIYVWCKLSEAIPADQRRKFYIFFICIMQYLVFQSFHQLAGVVDSLVGTAVTWRIDAASRVLINFSSFVEYLGLSQLVKLSLDQESDSKGVSSETLESEGFVYDRRETVRVPDFAINE